MEDSEGQLLVIASIWFWYATDIILCVHVDYLQVHDCACRKHKYNVAHMLYIQLWPCTVQTFVYMYTMHVLVHSWIIVHNMYMYM